MIDLTPVITALVVVLMTVCTVFVTTKLVPEIKKVWSPFADKYPMEAAFLEAQAEIGVKAAEQWLKTGSNGDKLVYALEYVEKQAEKYGFSYNKLDVQALVEAKVHDLKQAALAQKS